ncbi:MAG TPA: type II secretion system protein [Verrucomicrobiae bacterium]|nr:type II secretion system protein [Verrucomicrobiae bacterium]
MKSRRAPPAFTVIELIVVIAFIVAVLVLLVPALFRSGNEPRPSGAATVTTR